LFFLSKLPTQAEGVMSCQRRKKIYFKDSSKIFFNEHLNEPTEVKNNSHYPASPGVHFSISSTALKLTFPSSAPYHLINGFVYPFVCMQTKCFKNNRFDVSILFRASLSRAKRKLVDDEYLPHMGH